MITRTFKVESGGEILATTETKITKTTKDELEKKKEYTENRITCVTEDFNRKLLEYETDLAEINEQLNQF